MLALRQNKHRRLLAYLDQLRYCIYESHISGNRQGSQSQCRDSHRSCKPKLIREGELHWEQLYHRFASDNVDDMGSSERHNVSPSLFVTGVKT